MSWATGCRGSSRRDPRCASKTIVSDSKDLSSTRRCGAELALPDPGPSARPSMKPPMHAVACFVTPDPDKREELLQTLRSLAKEIRGEPGCLVCSVCLEEISAFFIVVSGWASDADLRRHLRSEYFRVLSGASRLLGASAEVGFLSSHPSPDSPP